MRKIILASQSKARQRILRRIGLKFTVAKSGVKESRAPARGCRALVIKNALKKAKAAALGFDSGIVIGADTVVLAGKRVIAKPRNLKDALNTLKILSGSPQWVYSGVAVVDIDSGKAYTACEKTRVYMTKLNDREIRGYFKKVSPLGKAGSFDIEGLGGVFVRRIEGSFYNVVGLPLVKLAGILKKIGLRIV